MQREKRKLNVKQKRREEKMENEISIVYLHTHRSLHAQKGALNIIVPAQNRTRSK